MQSSKYKKRIIIPVLGNHFDKNTAVSNRLLSLYSIINKSIEVYIVFIMLPHKNIYHTKYIEGIKCIYLQKPHRLGNRYLLSFISGMLAFYKFLKRTEDAYIYVPVSHSIIFYFILNKRIRKKHILFQERSELPDIILFHKGIYRFYDKLCYWIYTTKLIKIFDFMLIMTKQLISEYKLLTNSKMYHIPMTVDISRFKKKEKSFFKFDYICYCGTMNIGKDGVDILVKSYHKLVKEEKINHKLVLIGPKLPVEDYTEIYNYVDSYNLHDKVIFTGSVESSLIPIYLNNASCLCLARPDSIQARNGFPTKLGEYLATGNPVVVTEVGEIANYLIDGVNAYLSVPNDVDDFANKMYEAITDENASKIGNSGKELAYLNFNAELQAQKIIDIIKGFKNCIN
jgi:glycosyltransferase involved in cell wall biosynthesis